MYRQILKESDKIEKQIQDFRMAPKWWRVAARKKWKLEENSEVTEPEK